METLSRSVFHRIRESREAENRRFEPDTPLVLFILFSRIATGFAFASALLYLEGNPLGLYMVISAFVSMCLATVTSLTHLSTPFRFYRVLKNPSSRLTLEIGFSGIFLCVLVLVMAVEMAHIRNLGKLSSLFLSLTAILLLFGTTYAYRYTSHPLWNTARFFPYYVANGFVFASFFMDFIDLIQGKETGLVYVIRGIALVLVQAIGCYSYILFLLRSSPEAVHYIRRKKAGVLLFWVTANFLVPMLLCLVMVIMGSSNIYLTPILLVSIILGVYGERILFFLLEKPVFFFNRELEKPMRPIGHA
jgi:hypothetical protein